MCLHLSLLLSGCGQPHLYTELLTCQSHLLQESLAGVQNGDPMAYAVVFIALVNTVVSLYYYLLIVKAMYITKTDSPLPTFQSDASSKIALALCTAGIALFGVVSCIYEWIAAAGL